MEAKRDGNSVPTLLGVSSVDGITPTLAYVNPATGRLLVDLAGGGSGTVTTVSVATANGFAGTVATPTTTPVITLTTSVTGVLKGNGTAISAATPGTDYQAPITLTTTGTSGAATFVSNTLNIPNYATGGSGTVNSGTAGQLTYYAGTGTTVSGNTSANISAGALTLGISGGANQGSLILAGVTSGTITLVPTSAASGTLTLPAATDTLIGKATTDTLTNKTFNTAGTGNVFQINGTSITAVNGTGAVTLTTSPTFVTPVLGVATATSIQVATVTAATNTSVNINSGSYNTIQTYTPAAAGTATLDLSKGNVHHITMPAGNITIAISNGSAGQCFIVRILQDGTGSRLATFFTTIKWAGGTPPTLTTTASKADTFGFEVTTAGSAYDGYVVGQNI
jgi:hypothetical protein